MARPWEYCTRSILKAALQRLERVERADAVRRVRARIPVRDRPSPMGDALLVAGFRAERRLRRKRCAAMRALPVTPDTFMKEFGADQYEVTIGPQPRRGDRRPFT